MILKLLPTVLAGFTSILFAEPAPLAPPATGSIETSAASDQIKLERIGAILEARAAFIPPAAESASPKTLPDDPDKLKVLAIERLSTGLVLLTWQGRSDRFYAIQSSEDMVNWGRIISFLSTSGGIGLWGHTPDAPKTFYRVLEQPESEHLPGSGGSGGNGNGSPTLSLIYSNGRPSYAELQANVTPPRSAPSTATFYINGERYEDVFPAFTGGSLYRFPIPTERLSPGTQFIHAVLDGSYQTTPSPEDPEGGSTSITQSNFIKFTLNDGPGLLPLAFHVTETDIGSPNPPFPGLAAFTKIKARVPSAFGSWFILIRNSDGETVREFSGSSPADEIQIEVPWDGKAADGSTLPPDTYSIQLYLGGPQDYRTAPITTHANGPRWKALCVAEPLTRFKNTNWDPEAFRPPWAQSLPGTTGRGWDGIRGDVPEGSTIAQAWGPWKHLLGCEQIAIGFQKTLGKAGKWQAEKWINQGFFFAESGKNRNDSSIDPLSVFQAGGNPFNDYELGVFTGHGVLANAGTYPDAANQPVALPAQHYMPLVANKETGATYWVRSAQMPKYGAAGTKLNWMFLYTCNSLTDNGHYGVLHEMLEAGNLPFGPSLHILCGYATRIDIEGKMGDLLARALNQQAGGTITVIDAWRHVWQNTLNNKSANYDGIPKGVRVPRIICWPECENDTIYGVRQEDVTEPAAPFDQTRLKIINILEQ